MAEGSTTDLIENGQPVYCRYHKQESYQLYCRECQDFACFECLDKKHYKHGLCRLRDAKMDMGEELKNLITNEVHGNRRIDLIKDKLDENFTKLMETECELKVKVETTAKWMIEHIQKSKAQLLSSVTEIFSEYKEGIRDAKQLAEHLLSVTTCIDIERINDLAVSHVVKVLADLKECFDGENKHFDQYEIPFFKPNSKYLVGTIYKAVDVEDDCKCDENTKPSQTISVCNTATVFTQTDPEVDKDSETECEWFDAEDIPEEFPIENSSDEIRNDYPLKIELENSIKLVHKIIPISDTDALILADKKLRKITGHTLEGNLYSENVDDIAVINQGEVIILSENNEFIMRLLPDNRVVSFWNAKGGGTPLCLCVTEEDSLIVSLNFCSQSRWNVDYLIKLNNNGIEIWRMCKNIGCPYFILSNMSNFYLIYSWYSDLSYIKQLNSKCELVARYDGVFGFNPSVNFSCHGICIDSKGNLLVSDKRHHIVYALDKGLKFRRCIVNARDGLHNPAAIALHESRLWVADGQQIFIFQHEVTQNE